jgi:hypothetical protein
MPDRSMTLYAAFVIERKQAAKLAVLTERKIPCVDAS